MKRNVTRRELAAMVERLLRELEAHDEDYHHTTSAQLLQEARSLLARWNPGEQKKQGV